MIKICAPIVPYHEKGFYVRIDYMHGDADVYTDELYFFENSTAGEIVAENFYDVVYSYLNSRPEDYSSDWKDDIEIPKEYYHSDEEFDEISDRVFDILYKLDFNFAGDCTCDYMHHAKVIGVEITYWNSSNWCNCEFY